MVRVGHEQVLAPQCPHFSPLGGGVVEFNEIYFYGKDSDGDVVANVRRKAKSGPAP